MGKLHYVNRKIDGQKLAQVVSKDILKRLPTKPNHKAALRDPCVDFDVSGKALDDDDFEVIASALVKAIGYTSTEGNILKLEELCVKDNRLTARSLNFLAHVIRLAAHQIRDIDISRNRISITTSSDALAWERFLMSIERCCVLRRLDVTGNFLGPKGIEIFAKVYLREPEASTVREERAVDSNIVGEGSQGEIRTTVRDLRNLDIGAEFASSTERSISTPKGGEKTFQTVSSSTLEQSPNTGNEKLLSFYSTKSGLQSIPYIILVDTLINDACALYLSYILPQHRLPTQLLPYVPAVKPGLAAQQERDYDQVDECRGIVYKPNTDLSSVGAMLLSFAEQERGTEENTSGLNGFPTSRDTSTPTRSRRKSAHSDPIASATNADKLDRTRSRIQGETLKDKGPGSNDLWRSSLRMLGAVRLVLLEPPKTENVISYSSAIRSIAPTPLGVANPNAPILSRYPQARRDSLKTFNAPLRKPNEETSTNTQTHQNGATKSTILPTTDKPFERSTLRGGLPAKIWGDIIGLAVGAGTDLSSRQKKAVVEWGSKRETLRRELELLGGTRGFQIWKVLEGMECLMYEPLDS